MLPNSGLSSNLGFFIEGMEALNIDRKNGKAVYQFIQDP